MLVMLSMTYPLHKIDDVVKAYLSVKRPPHIKIVGTYEWLDGEAKSIQIIEIEKGHEEEGLKALDKLLLVQYRNIEGLKMKTQHVFTTEEALALLGITPPKR